LFDYRTNSRPFCKTQKENLVSSIKGRTVFGAVALVLVALGATAFAAPPASEVLLPATTKGYVSVASVPELVESFDATQWGWLLSDPQMKPLFENWQRLMRERFGVTGEELGVSWEELGAVVSGELTVAVIQPKPKPLPKSKRVARRRTVLPVSPQAVIVLMADVTGRTEKAKTLLRKIDADLIKRGAKKRQRTVAGVQITVFDLPKERRKATQRHAIYFLKNDLLVACDNEPVIGGIAERLAGKKSPSLADVDAYRMVTKRCKLAAAGLQPQLRWFMEPFGYIASVQSAANDGRRIRGKKMLPILQAQGFDAIEGLGGFVNFRTGRYDVLHRTFVYAPGSDGWAGLAKTRLRLAARMLTFPSGGDLEPQPFVPRNVSSYDSINFDLKNAFDTIGTLVDALIGEPGIWDEIVEGLKFDPDGPKVDFEKELFDQFSGRVSIVTGNSNPPGAKSERVMMMLEAKDKQAEAILKQFVEKMAKSNDEISKRTYKGHVIWEPTTREDSDEENHDTFLGIPYGAMAVANGQFMMATDVAFLKEFLNVLPPEDQLRGTAEYRTIQACLAELADGQPSGTFFTRTDQIVHHGYELLRKGQTPTTERMPWQLLRGLFEPDWLFGPQKNARSLGRDRQPRGVGNLPPYDQVRPYLLPAGLAMTSESDGWMFTGFTIGEDDGDCGRHLRRMLRPGIFFRSTTCNRRDAPNGGLAPKRGFLQTLHRMRIR